MNKCKIKTIIIIFFFGCLPFIIVSCSNDTSVEGVIVEKEYHGSSMLPTTIGKMTTYIRHPEAFYIVVIDKNSCKRSYQVDKISYDTLKVGSYFSEVNFKTKKSK